MAVTEGQVLARLDDTTERSYLALAEAQLVAARGALVEVEVRHKKARLDLERQLQLLHQRLIRQADLDAAHAEADSLEARLANQREQVVVAEREIDVQRIALENTVIRAPFSGVAISKDAQPGEMISPVSAGGGFTRTGVCTIVDMSSLEIEVEAGLFIVQAVYGVAGQSGAAQQHDRRGDRAATFPLPSASRHECARGYGTRIRDDDRGGLEVDVLAGSSSWDRRRMDLRSKTVALEARRLVELP